MCVLSHFSCVQLFATLWTCSLPGSSVHGILPYWNGLPFPSPGDLPDPRIKPALLGLLHWQAGSLPLVPPGKPMLNTSLSGVYPYNTLPLMVIVTNQKEGRSVTKLPDSITELPSNWIGCQLPVCDSLWNNARESNQNPNASVPYHRLLTASLHHMKAPRLLIRVGHSSWGMSLLCSPLHQLRIKATFLFPPNSVSVIYIWLRWAEKAKILASNNFTLSTQYVKLTLPSHWG